MMFNVRAISQWSRAAYLLAALLACSLWPAASALASTSPSPNGASLRIQVPHKVHTRQHYAIKIIGSYSASDLRGKPFLVWLIQYSPKSCSDTAGGEYKRNDSQLWFHGVVGPSPFVQRLRLIAHAKFGARRVCAYLYPKKVGPQSRLRPIATASKLYYDVRR